MIGFTEHERELAADGGALASILTELAAAQHWLARHQPPVSKFYPTTIGLCADSVDEVDRVAALLGLPEPNWAPDETVYMAQKRFGSSVTYRVSYVVKAAEQDDPAGVEDAPQLEPVAA